MVIRQSKNKDIRQSRNIVLQQNKTKGIIKQAQLYTTKLCENLSSFEPFDNTVVPDDCIDRLVAHRVVSQFHVDNPTIAKQLQAESFTKYIEYDSKLSVTLDVWSPGKEYLYLRRAKALLFKWFSKFKIDICDIGYEVTPGETYISSGGEVSILSKLMDKSHWTTTANCIDDTVRFIISNRAFKRAATQHINNCNVTRKEKRKLYTRFQHKTDIGFHVFRHLLLEHVLTIVDGARASSVPKSNEKRRFINVEAMFPIILQRAAAQAILKVLKRNGNDLGNFRYESKRGPSGYQTIEHSAQALHGLMIKDGRFATIDFSNASDSVTIAAVCSLFPKQVVDYLLRVRSHFVVIDDVFHCPNKLSSMGNGFTFEVMTVMLYAIAMTMTPFCRVYGDDVIIPNEHASQFVRVCELIDFRVNVKKTFINSFFRESCGYFYSDHIKDYIVSFDFGQIKSLSDVIITHNKLAVIIEADQVSESLKEKLILTRDQLNALIHASRKGPMPPSLSTQRKYLASYVFDCGYRKKQKRCKELTSLRQHYIEKNGQHFLDCQIETSDVSLVYMPFFVPDKSNHVFTSKRDLETILPAIYSGKRMKSVIKGKGRWIDLPGFIYSDGTITLISNLISSQRIWVDRLNGVYMNHEKK